MFTQTALKAAALALALALAPAANAQEAPSRDTGVGKAIAAQGNQALREIRADLMARVLALKPKLPKAPRVVKMSQPAGATIATGAGVRCSK
jgi:hypothetical protein